KPATDSSQAERPLLPPFLARGSLLFPVSARRHRLQAPFWRASLRRRKSRSKLDLANFPASARIAWFSAPVVMRRVLYPLARTSSIRELITQQLGIQSR